MFDEGEDAAEGEEALGAAGGRVFFSTDQSAEGRDQELWAAEGGCADAVRLTDFAHPSAFSFPFFPFPRATLGEAFLFVADDGEHGVEIWRSDGTPEGTDLLDLETRRTLGAGSYPVGLTPWGDRVLFFASEPDVHDPRDVVAALEAALPAEWELVNSSGHCSFYFAQMPSRPQERFLTIREFGAIGNGIPFAMGVAAARPDRTVVLFDGDGSLLMHVQELDTIRRHGLNVLIVALNDGAYGSEIHKLRAEGLSDRGAVFGRPDLAAIARGFGIGGETIADLAALPALIARFAKSGGAAVWDVPISDRVQSPVIRRAHPSGPSHKGPA